MALKTFKEYKAKLNEGFLDDDNEEALTADKFTDVKEGDEENPFPAENDDEESTLDAPNDENDVDLSDEIGSVEAEADKTEKEDLADLKLDELSDDDDIKDSGDEKAEEKKAEQETAERTADTMDQLKDAIATLTTKIEALTDKVDNSDENAEVTEGGDELGGDLGGDDLSGEGGDLGSGSEGSDLGGGDLGGDLGGEGDDVSDNPEGGEGTEGGEGSNEGGEGDLGEDNSNEGSDDDFGEDESDNTKSEAYNFYMKKGKLLNSNSGSIIGKAVNEKLYDLDEDFMNIVKAKIRKLIEAKKLELRNKNF